VKKFGLILLVLILILAAFLIFRVKVTKEGPILLSKNWELISSTQVKEDGNLISTDKFKPENWYPTAVPSTVLNALVRDGVYPDPRSGMNNFLIPDVSDTFNAEYNLSQYSYLPDKRNPWKDPYWFRTEFKLPGSYQGKHVWLNFKGINYRADVWLNGNKIADSGTMAGMFQRFKFDVTDYARPGKTNCLAVKIYQLDHTGVPGGLPKRVFGRSHEHDHEIDKDVTLKISGGWDCAPVVRDRNMGIWQDVYVNSTGSVDIRNPYIVTDLPLPDTSRARLTISAELSNVGRTDQSGVLKGKIDLIDKLLFPSYTRFLQGKMESVTFKKKVDIGAGETKTVTFTPDDFAQLEIKNPYLWWPNGYGEQYLHNLKLTFEINGKVSVRENTTFGIREITNELKEIDGDYGRVFYINGQRVFCKGGWLQPDVLLNMDEKRIYDEARLLAGSNINMIATEDNPSPPEEFMEACDKYGLMLWETFYQCWRMRPDDETANNPLDHDLALKCSYDIIKRYRNNPSLVLWCGANEVTPCEDIYVKLRQYIRELDATRPFIPASNIDWDIDKYTPYIKADLPTGTTDNGAPDYNWNPENYYFEKILEVKNQMFRNELGAPALPPLSSLKKFIPDLGKTGAGYPFPLNITWNHHGAWGEYAYKGFDRALRELYGEPKSVEDYAAKGQFLNANVYRAMFEAANHRMWDITSGVMLWKLNSCWPTVIWQIYDWYLNPNSAYYYTKIACEPLHIQLNANDFIVSVINTHHQPQEQMEVMAKVYDFDLNLKWQNLNTVDVGEDQYKEIFVIPKIADLTPVYFVKLELRNSSGKLVSSNFYWLSSVSPADFSELAQLPPAKLDIAYQIEKRGEERVARVTVKNPTGNLALLIHLGVTKGPDGDEVLPTFWDDNYFSLMPGEKRELNATFAIADLAGARPVVSVIR
jgi:hypothetical protein